MPIIECRKKKTVLTLKRLRRKPFTYLRKTLRVSGLEKNLAVAQLMYIVGMSARMNAAVGAPEDYRRRQLAMILEGMFSASKSYLKNRVLSLLPEQWIKRAQEMSVAYLIRCSNLAGKIIALDEAYLSNDVLALIRQLLSEGHGERNLCTNGEATELKVTGPIALIDTGLEEKKRQQQDQSRAITVAVDATEGAISAAKNSVIRSVSTEGIKRQHRLEKWTAVFREFALGLQDDLLVTINEKALASIVKSLTIDRQPCVSSNKSKLCFALLPTSDSTHGGNS